MNYLETLNSEQRRAVLATEGPVLIVAGAGAGKTKTITHRIMHLIKNGVSPEKILAITFTNKAANEMKDRVIKLLNDDSNSSYLYKRVPFMSTFHSLGVNIIKENSALLDMTRHFSIFDTSDSKKTLKNALVYINIDPKENLDKVRHIISKEKGNGINLSEYLKRDAYDKTVEMTKKAWTKYEDILKKEHALDFDDLLLITLKLFQKYPDILEKYQERFLYIHIDEYQDTNRVQNEIILLLAKKYKNLCVVGDTDQNIYSWRGAEIKNMLHFEKTYPEVKTIFLEQNYRSTKNILAVANEIIRKNNFRIPKKLFTENSLGEKIGIFKAYNEKDEAHFIALKSKEFIENGIKAEKIAVLYRANFQSRVLEDAFMSLGIPYQMFGTKFFERKEVKDILSLIKASLNPENLNDFFRIINTPPRGIGKMTMQKIISGKENELPESTKIKIQNFREMLLGFKNILLIEKTSVAIRHIIKHSGMENLYKTNLEEDLERLENIMELVTLALGYDELEAEEGVEKFLTDSALASGEDSLYGEKSGVKLMTVHSSKGLEFDYVFICGLENNLFPHQKISDKRKPPEEDEEERRLFYVAVTRAGRKLFLTHSEVRTIFGAIEINSPSEFIKDIPEKYIENETYSEVPVRTPLVSINF